MLYDEGDILSGATHVETPQPRNENYYRWRLWAVGSSQ